MKGAITKIVWGGIYMNKKVILLFIIISTLLIACSKNEKQKSESNTSEKNITTQKFEVLNSEATDNTSYITEDKHLDKNILNDNKLIINTEKIQSITIRDGNTGETVLEITDKDTIIKISEDISSVTFMEHEAIQSDGWKYELIINADKEIHIVISSNTHLYIWIEDISQKTDCETSFDLLGYIENTLLNSKK